MATESHISSETYKSYWTEGSGASGNGLTYNGDNLKFGYVFDENTYDKDVNNYNFAKIEEYLASAFESKGDGTGNKRQNVDSGGIKAQLLDLIYPIGSIYMSMRNISPEDFLGGTWTRIESKFLLGITGDSVPSTGGRTSVKLTTDNLPEHTHTINHNHGKHSHDISSTGNILIGNSNVIRDEVKIDNSSKHYAYVSKASTGASSSGLDKTSTAASTKNSVDINYTGNSGKSGKSSQEITAIDILPPYQTVYMWQRTA